MKFATTNNWPSSGDGARTLNPDPNWPQLPSKWVWGQVSSVSIDERQHAWVLQRPGTIRTDQKGKAAPPLELGLVTEDVEAAFGRAVEAGAIAVKKPERKPWGQLVGYVRDINGFLVEICSPMA